MPLINDHRKSRIRAEIIRRWKERDNFKSKHKKIYKYVMTELTHKPDLGIDYFKTLGDVEQY